MHLIQTCLYDVCICMYLFAHTYKISQLLCCLYVLQDTYKYKQAGSLMELDAHYELDILILNNNMVLVQVHAATCPMTRHPSRDRVKIEKTVCAFWICAYSHQGSCMFVCVCIFEHIHT